MSEANSPNYALGKEHGEDDSARASACPPAPIIGPAPPDDRYPVMYMRGYASTYAPNPCDHSGDCRIARERRRLERAAAEAKEQAI